MIMEKVFKTGDRVCFKSPESDWEFKGTVLVELPEMELEAQDRRLSKRYLVSMDDDFDVTFNEGTHLSGYNQLVFAPWALELCNL